ncbi:flagellar biosynthetic protein FliR, partial [Aquabacterium sp.]|uniref:flagellar biosynthetic protein FliR n=1 Tax=Aquabacterium sp. TaxID=1872578 RepID=UPI0035B45817
SPLMTGAVAQQVLIGLTMGFAARVVFAAIEFAGEMVGLQMGLNFASFFDPTTGGQSTAVSRFYGTIASWLFVVLNGHLLLTAAVVQSFQAFPVSAEPLAFLATVQPQVWGTEVFRLGLWIALPIMAMLLLVNMVMGVMSRVASQLNIFAVGFPVTLGVGLLGLWMTLPMMQVPFTLALERMLGYFL